MVLITWKGARRVMSSAREEGVVSGCVHAGRVEGRRVISDGGVEGRDVKCVEAMER
jgi:hypothetical protein